MSFTNYRFRCALKTQNERLLHETYAWKSWLYPLAPFLLMVISLFLFALCIICRSIISRPLALAILCLHLSCRCAIFRN
ncbi:hypothetical protein F4803DRAFT_541771 [Xylaria telfairii]|nr:hypothetical protein F4803DRAFT_541771 [Xylaria telfairii]